MRVLIVDDHEAARKCLRVVVGLDSTLRLVGEAVNGQEALKAADAFHPDVVLMDLTMPVMGGLDATRELRRQFPVLKIVGLSMHDDPSQERAMFNEGADAYLVKGGDSSEILRTIREVANPLAGRGAV